MKRSFISIGFLLALSACRSTSTSDGNSAFCPKTVSAPPQIPGQAIRHLLADYWIENGAEPDRVLLTEAQIEAHNATITNLQTEGWPTGRWNPFERPVDHAKLLGYFENRLRILRERTRKTWQFIDGTHPQEPFFSTINAEMLQSSATDEVRAVVDETPLRCYPTSIPIVEHIDDFAFDMFQCSQARFGDVVRVIRKGKTFWYVWTDYTEGWIDPRALSEPIDAATENQFTKADRFAVVTADMSGVRSAQNELLGIARLGLKLPLVESSGDRARVKIVDRRGTMREGWIDLDAIHEGYVPFTRRNLLHHTFALLHTPYGWGDTAGYRDCSRLFMDLFSVFGIQLPRNSAYQSRAGINTLDVSTLSPTEKISAIRDAATRRIVLLYLPGHIMLYLGEDQENLYAFHQFSGYLVPCSGRTSTTPAGTLETMYRVNRATVTTLSLGAGSSRKSFLERITKLVLF